LCLLSVWGIVFINRYTNFKISANLNTPPTNPLSEIKLSGKEWFVSPQGSSSNPGTKDAPFDLDFALAGAGGRIGPGDIVWLLGGRYLGGHHSYLKGTKESPIILRAYPGERVTLDGNGYGGVLTDSYSQYVWYWGLEITNSLSERKVPDYSHDRGYGLNLFGTGVKVINSVVHNVGHPGIGFWSSVGDGGEIYGTLIWGNGIYDFTNPSMPNGWTRGSGIYAQNQTGKRYIRDVIAFRNFTTGFKVYTEGGWANGFILEGNVCFDTPDWNLFVAAKNNPIDSVLLDSNFTYRNPGDTRRQLWVGYYNTIQGEAILKNNYFVGNDTLPLLIKSFKKIVAENNTLVSNTSIFSLVNVPTDAEYQIDKNNYFSPKGPQSKLFSENDLGKTFTEWQASGFDQASSFTSSKPSKNAVFIRPNLYEPGERTHIIIYNFEGKDQESVSLEKAGLKIGDLFEIRDAQNYFGNPIYQGVYDGNPVSLPLNLSEVSPIVGEVTHFQNKHTDKEFNVFVLIKTGKAPLPTPSNLSI